MDRGLACLREELPDERLQEAWAQGRRIPVQQAIAEAQSVILTG
jgi:hypothetical protein